MALGVHEFFSIIMKTCKQAAFGLPSLAREDYGKCSIILLSQRKSNSHVL